MSKFRILSIFLAVGLLVGALGVGPVLAGQIDVTGLDTRDASYAPAAIKVAENEVEWTDANGDDVKYVKASAAGEPVYFYIKDDALETVSDPQIALWDADGSTATFTTTGEAAGFNVLTGVVGASIPSGATFTLTGEPDDNKDRVGSSGGNLSGAGKDVPADAFEAGVSKYVNEWFATTTFVMFNNATKFDVRDTPDSPTYGSEVATTTTGGILGGNAAGTPVHEVSKFDVFTGTATSTLTSQAIESPENDLVKILGGTTGSYERVKITFTHHYRDMWKADDADKRRARVVSTSDPQGEYVTIMEVAGIGSTGESSTSNVFRGTVKISSDSSSRGSGPGGEGEDNDGVYVQDGDTLTVEYLDKDGDVVDSDAITADLSAPSIGSVVPADGSNLEAGNPTLEFTATDTGSGIPVGKKDAPVSDYFDVYIGTQLHKSGDMKGKVVTLDADTTDRKKGDPKDGQKIADDDLAFVATTGGYRVIFSSTESWVTRFKEVVDSEKFYVTLRARDLAGNQAVTNVGITIDDSNPTAHSAKTGTAWNEATEKEKTGVLTAVRLVMSEAIDADTVDPDDFEVGGETPSAAVVGTGNNVTDASHNIYLTMADDLDPDATPNVEVVGTISDLSGNNLDTTKSTAARVAEDGLGPTVTVSRDMALVAKKGDKVEISIASDEKVKAGGVKVSIYGPDDSNANVGATGAKAGEPLMYSLTRTVGSADDTGAYGISVKITDLGGNDGYSAMKATDEEVAAKNVKVVSSTVTITVGNGPIADRDADGSLTDEVTKIEIMKDGETIATTTQVEVTAVDASERTVTLRAKAPSHQQGSDETTPNLSGADAAVVTYHYASADHTFEIDMKKPTVAIEYGGNALDKADVPNTSPFVNVKFTDDEYPGDSYKDVKLTSAMLTMGDGEPTDIMEAIAANANGRDYLWAGVNLALGEYELKVTGEDTAGNEASMTVTFEIVEKPATEVALNPGVNLISLPGTPATSSVEGVFGDSDVTAVLTYDPSTPTKWLAAEKASDGSWVGNLTHVSASLGYWVTTTSFDPLEVDIVSFSAGGATLPPTHNLVPGWNLVAVTTLNLVDADGNEVSATAKAKAVDANTYLGNYWLRAITYDAAAGRFITRGPDDDPAPMLDVGKGYFVWMTRPHTVVP